MAIFFILCFPYLKPIAAFPHDSFGNDMSVFDANQNGKMELYIPSVADTGTMVYEHLMNNMYEEKTKLDHIMCVAIGYADGDSLVDLFARYFNSVGTVTDTLGCYEARSPNSYPDTMVWQVFQQYSDVAPLIDLDQDGQMDIPFGEYRYLRIFENIGDNLYTEVYRCTLTTVWVGCEIVCGDFDGDSLLEMICGDTDGRIYILENTAIGIDSFQLVWTYHLPSGFGNAYMIAKGNDMDNDGKPEFIVGVNSYDRYCFTMFESNGNNSYQKIWQYFYYFGGSLTDGDVNCGDVDGDGIDEMVTFSGIELCVWKCVGPDSFVKIWQNFYGYDLTNGVLLVYDLNQNGLDEIVLSGGSWFGPASPPAKTYIYEKAVGVTWYCPAPLDTFHPGDTINLHWKFDETVSLDSLRLYWSHPQLGWHFIYEGPATDTLYQWVVPDTQANIPFRIWVAVSGNCRYDSLYSPSFYIRRVPGVEENALCLMPNVPCLEVYPNPFSEKINIRYSIKDDQKSEISLRIYDATGRLVKDFSRLPICWDGTDDSGYKLPPGRYFIYLKSRDFFVIKKVIKIGG